MTSAMNPLVAFGAGKVILLGEHSVVYGYPAIAGPLTIGVVARGGPSRSCVLDVPVTADAAQKRMMRKAFARAAKLVGEPKVKVTLEPQLPLSAGLGSSAALAVATSRVLLQAAGQAPTAKATARLAWEMEQEFHGTPSGVDHTTSAEEKLILYRRVQSPAGVTGRARELKSPRPVSVVVALAGARSPTKLTVGALRERQARWPERYKRLFGQVGRLVTEAAKTVEAGDLEGLGDAMNVNQGLLNALGLSSPALEDMVFRLRSLGALGAKFTGAGGDGGAVIGLFPEPEPVVAQLTRDGVRCFASQLAGPRVQGDIP
ncbi:mevalonate kinase [Corallococcus exiguus]|nr:mevalonate kinase [Corallococcus exiguus]